MKRLFILITLLGCFFVANSQTKDVYANLHVYGKIIGDSIVVLQKYGSSDTTFLFTHSDGTIDTVGITQLKAWMGTGSGVGVTYVGLTGASQFDVTGSPVIATGTFNIDWKDTIPNLVFAGPDTGTAPGKPRFRALVAADIPNIGAGYIQNQTASNQTGGYRITGNAILNGGKLGLNRTSPNAWIHGYFAKSADTMFNLRNSVTGNDTGVWVLGNGYMGINKNNPTVALDVVGQIKASSVISTPVYVLGNTLSDGLYAGSVDRARVAMNSIAGSTISVDLYSGSTANTGGYIRGFIDDVQKFHVNSTGFGIGTTAPNHPLDVVGLAKFSGGITATPYIFIGASTDGWRFLNSTGSISFVKINGLNGNVGIGVALPEEILDINGRVKLAQTSAPATTTDKLYNVGGNLYWNALEISPQVKGANLVYAGPNGGASALPTWRKIYEDDIVLGNATIFVGNATNGAKARSVTGDISMSNTGATTIQDNAVDGSDISVTGETTKDLLRFNGTDWVHYADSNYFSTSGDTVHGPILGTWDISAVGNLNAGGNYLMDDTITVLELRSGNLTMGSGDSTEHANTTLLAGANASVNLYGNSPGEVRLNAGSDYLSITPTNTVITTGLKVTGTIESIANAQKSKIGQAATEPDVPTGAWQFWYDTTNAKMYLVVDQAGTQFKVELL